MAFRPQRVLIERAALGYPLGASLRDYFEARGVETLVGISPARLLGNVTLQERYRESKRTLMVALRKGRTFQTCRPSAHYQLPIASSCPARCEYCYLVTRFGANQFVKVYVNVEEILDTARELIRSRAPETTYFEGSATSDPVPVEPFTGSLQKAIEFFANQPLGRFKFATKFADISTLTGLDHRQHTKVRFSLNSRSNIKAFEHGTPALEHRIEAARQMAQAGYPVGFMVAPIIIGPGWEEGYEAMFAELAHGFRIDMRGSRVTFELITHRFTARAKRAIRHLFPESRVPMDPARRVFKFGQFGYGKYVYPPEAMREVGHRFRTWAARFFPGSEIEYFI